jgi:hypothetical protein
MLRCVAAFLPVAMTAVCLGLLEPALAASDSERVCLIFVLLALARVPVWLSSFFVNGRTGLAT